MSNEIKATVIMPVFNNEKSLTAGVESVLHQSMAREKYELLLINDGSTDGSGKILAEYEKHTDCITLITQKNSGVSAARNTGIREAKGEYIFFLDADDTISSNTLESVCSFFDEHKSETDVVTYRIDYRDRKGNTSSHRRYEILTHDGVYNLREDANKNIAQTTMNICVKNGCDFFNERLTLAEDQLFITRAVMKKKTIGYVSSAVYTYNKSSFSSSSIKNHPYYCFESVIYFFDCLLKEFTENEGGTDKYVQSLILYNLNWRMTSGKLLPQGMTPLQKKYHYVCLNEVMKFIDVKTVCDSIYIEPFHRKFFLGLKGVRLDLEVSGGGYRVKAGREIAFECDEAEIVLSRLKVLGGEIVITGYIKAFVTDETKVLMTIGGKDATFFRSYKSFYKSKTECCLFYGFNERFKTDKKTELNFSLSFDGREVNTRLHFEPFCALNRERKRCVNGEIIFSLGDDESSVIAEKSDEKARRKIKMQTDRAVAKKLPGAFLYRLAARFFSRRKIYLYSDCADVAGNGLKKFNSDCSKKDGIRRYYVVNGSVDLSAGKTVKAGSRKHKLLFLISDKIFTSFISVGIVSPFGGGAVREYSDIFDAEIVYLQHGVMHACLPLLYSRERCLADRIVVTTEFERKKLVERYHYRPDDIISVTPPARLIDIGEKQRRILYMPSWRSAYVGELCADGREKNDENFKKSDFYRSVEKLISSKKLADILEKNDVEIEIKSHPNFRCYDDLFESGSDRIKFIKGVAGLGDYSALVTDFSSCVFDYLPLRRPVIYFVPDYEEYRSGALHSYNGTDLPMEKGFGKLTQSVDELLAEIKKLIENDFEISDEYADRMKSFYGDL